MYLSVQDFAKAAGVTQPAIYGRISTTLAPYVIIENGKKRISDEALKLYETSKTDKETPEGQSESLQSYIKLLKGQIDEQKKQLDDQRTMLSFLQEQIRIKDSQIESLNATIQSQADMAKHVAEVASQAQKLHALEMKADDQDPVEEADQNQSEVVEQGKQVPMAAVPEESKPKKRSWLDWFTGR